MILKKGNIWQSYKDSDYFIFTGNSYINIKKELVMGRGVALQVKNKFPALPKIFGSKISHLNKYGLIILEDMKPKIGVFQVKYRYNDNANLDLVEYSVEKLIKYINLNNLQDKKINLNYPAIGFGHLNKKVIQPIIEKLPNNVTIWELQNDV